MGTIVRDGFDLRSVLTDDELATIPPKSLTIKGQSEKTVDIGLNPAERHLAWVNSCDDIKTMMVEVNKLLDLVKEVEYSEVVINNALSINLNKSLDSNLRVLRRCTDYLTYVNSADTVRYLRRGDCLATACIYGSLIKKAILEKSVVVDLLNYNPLW